MIGQGFFFFFKYTPHDHAICINGLSGGLQYETYQFEPPYSNLNFTKNWLMNIYNRFPTIRKSLGNWNSIFFLWKSLNFAQLYILKTLSACWKSCGLSFSLRCRNPVITITTMNVQNWNVINKTKVFEFLFQVVATRQ